MTGSFSRVVLEGILNSDIKLVLSVEKTRDRAGRSIPSPDVRVLKAGLEAGQPTLQIRRLFN